MRGTHKLKVHRRRSAVEFMHLSREIERATKDGWIGWFDGACEPNPGRMGCGAVLQRDNMPVDAVGLLLGHGTNNIAEYNGLIELLKLARHHAASDLLICGDSMLVIMQMTGRWKIKQEHLQVLNQTARHILKDIVGVRWAWIPRHENVQADLLSKDGLR